MSGLFSRFVPSKTTSGKSDVEKDAVDPYSTYNDIEEGANYVPKKPSFGRVSRSTQPTDQIASSSTSSEAKGDDMGSFKTATTKKRPFQAKSSFMVSNAALQKQPPYTTSSEDEEEIVTRNPTFDQTTSKQRAGKMRRRSEQQSIRSEYFSNFKSASQIHSSTDEESSDDEYAQSRIGAGMYTRRKRTLADLEASSTAEPQSSINQERAERVLELIKQNNFQTTEQQVEQATRRVFGGHIVFFNNLRKFVSAFEGSVRAPANDFWRTGISHSFRELGKLFIDHFQKPSDRESQEIQSGYTLVAQHFASDQEPTTRPVNAQQLQIIWPILENSIYVVRTMDVVDFKSITSNEMKYEINPEKVASLAISMANRIANFENLGIRLSFNPDFFADLKTAFTIPGMEKTQSTKNNSDFAVRQAIDYFKKYTMGDYDPSIPVHVKLEDQGSLNTFITDFDLFYEEYVRNVINKLKTTYSTKPNEIFEWEVYDGSLRTPPIVDYMLEIRHLSQQEQEKRIFSAIGLKGDLKSDLMTLLERMAKPSYFSAIQQAYSKVTASGKSLYEIINDEKVLGPRFVNLCRAQYNCDGGAASRYTSAIRATKSELVVGQAIDEFFRALNRPTSRQFRMQAPNFDSFQSIAQSNSQLEEFIRATVLQSDAIL